MRVKRKVCACVQISTNDSSGMERGREGKREEKE